MTPYFTRDGITIFNADCEAIMPTLPADFDIVCTSPPYNLGNTTGGGFPLGHYANGEGLSKRGGGGKWAAAGRDGGLAFGYGEYADNLPHEDYVTWQHRVLRLCWERLNETGAIFYNHKPRVLGGSLVSPLEYVPHGLPIRQIIIWKRAGGINFSPAFYLPTHEWIVVIAKPDFRLKSKGASGVGDVWEITQESNNRHPAPFPLELPMRVMETTEPRKVLDPFGGSGTTGLAAWLSNSECVLCEQSQLFCEDAQARLEREMQQGRMFRDPQPVASQRDLFGEET